MRVSLDDFGTGYSSLSYLNRVPLDLLKIDHCFVRDIHVDPGAKGVVSAVISMAHSLGLEVVAEGADCDEQVDVLVEIGCDAVQGFVFAPRCRSASSPSCSSRARDLLLRWRLRAWRARNMRPL